MTTPTAGSTGRRTNRRSSAKPKPKPTEHNGQVAGADGTAASATPKTDPNTPAGVVRDGFILDFILTIADRYRAFRQEHPEPRA